jgi:hypothetical protein
MASWYLGPWRIGQGIARRAGLAGGFVALAGGLTLGVATAADPGTVGAAPATPQTPAGSAAPAAPASAKVAPAPRLPLHQVIASRIGSRRPAAQSTAPVRPAQRLIVGRLTSFANGTATVQTAGGKVITIHAGAQTKLPRRRTRVGDQVVVIGVPGPNGTFLARAVLSRPAPLHGQPRNPPSAAARPAQQVARRGGTRSASYGSDWSRSWTRRARKTWSSWY